MGLMLIPIAVMNNIYSNFVEGIGNSKQNAEQAAAKLFLKILNR